MIQCQCPRCGRGFSLRDPTTAQTVKCPFCQHAFIVSPPKASGDTTLGLAEASASEKTDVFDAIAEEKPVSLRAKAEAARRASAKVPAARPKTPAPIRLLRSAHWMALGAALAIVLADLAIPGVDMRTCYTNLPPGVCARPVYDLGQVGLVRDAIDRACTDLKAVQFDVRPALTGRRHIVLACRSPLAGSIEECAARLSGLTVQAAKPAESEPAGEADAVAVVAAGKAVLLAANKDLLPPEAIAAALAEPPGGGSIIDLPWSQRLSADHIYLPASGRGGAQFQLARRVEAPATQAGDPPPPGEGLERVVLTASGKGGYQRQVEHLEPASRRQADAMMVEGIDVAVEIAGQASGSGLFSTPPVAAMIYRDLPADQLFVVARDGRELVGVERFSRRAIAKAMFALLALAASAGAGIAVLRALATRGQKAGKLTAGASWTLAGLAVAGVAAVAICFGGFWAAFRTLTFFFAMPAALDVAAHAVLGLAFAAVPVVTMNVVRKFVG